MARALSHATLTVMLRHKLQPLTLPANPLSKVLATLQSRLLLGHHTDRLPRTSNLLVVFSGW